MAWLTHVLYLACLTHFPVVIARGIPDPRRRGDMKAEEEKEEEVDLMDNNVHTGSKATSNITSYQRNIENKRDIQYLFKSMKYFQQKGTSNISSYPRNIFSKMDIEYLSPGIYSKQNFGLGMLWFYWQENWSHFAILSFREKRESATL